MERKITTAVIPAAGKGNRIADLPLTRILPKPLLPLLNKPIIEHIITWLKKIGVKKIYLIVSFKKEIFKDYFGNGQDFGVKIEYIECPDPNNIGGLADGIFLARKFINDPFMVVLGDDFTITRSYKPRIPPRLERGLVAGRSPAFKSLVNTFFEKKAVALEAVVKENDLDALRRTCEVSLDKKGKIIDIVEKPKKPKWRVRGCGIYVFDSKVFDFIKKTPVENGKRDITRTIQIMAKQTGKVFGFLVETNININTFADLHRATLMILGGKTAL